MIGGTTRNSAGGRNGSYYGGSTNASTTRKNIFGMAANTALKKTHS